MNSNELGFFEDGPGLPMCPDSPNCGCAECHAGHEFRNEIEEDCRQCILDWQEQHEIQHDARAGAMGVACEECLKINCAMLKLEAKS